MREILWRELAQPIHARSRLDRRESSLAPDSNSAPKRYAYGFSTNTEDRFQGFHSGNILVIVDEASGVDEFIFNAIRGVITAKNSRLLLIGNPHGYAGTFYDAFHKNRKRFANNPHISVRFARLQSSVGHHRGTTSKTSTITRPEDRLQLRHSRRVIPTFPTEARTQSNITLRRFIKRSFNSKVGSRPLPRCRPTIFRLPNASTRSVPRRSRRHLDSLTRHRKRR